MLCIGHRGAMGYAPENTLKSFAKAVALGVQCVELDVYCVEGTLLVFHDDFLERTTNGRGRLMDHDLAYLRSLQLAEQQRIPTLQEVCELLDGRVGVNIELKGPNTAPAVADFLLRQSRIDWALVSSFDHSALQEMRALMPDVRLGLLLEAGVKSFAWSAQMRALKPYSLHPSLHSVDRPLIARAREYGLKIFVYTVNRISDIKRMEALGVDGVFTDYPDKVLSRVAVTHANRWP